MNKPILFCNIAWMDRYAGVTKADKPRGGGRWVDENGRAHEACNFLICDDGNVYGHFETIKGEIDREVRLERLGANVGEDSVSGVDVIWTAPFNGNGARHVVGWYRNATVYRNRTDFLTVPSTQHKIDKIKNFRVMAKAADTMLLPLNKRILELGRGPGWSGQASWWYVEQSTNPEVPAFLEKLRVMMDDMLPAVSSSKFGAVKSGDKGQGFGLTQPERLAVERRAMDIVSEWFQRQGYSVQDTSLTKPYDFEAKKDGATILVEVKGTTSNVAEAISMTHREVDLHRTQKGKTALMLVTSIRLVERGERAFATGGELETLIGWDIDEWVLSPTAFRVSRIACSTSV